MATSVTFPHPASYQQWAIDLEEFAGLPQTPTETAIISAWEQSENPASQVGGYTSAGGYNALNTSLKTGSSGLEPGSSFIPVYPDVETALAATTSTLRQSNYAPELAALQAQSGSGLVSALGSPGHVWGSSPSLVAKILGVGASTALAGGNSNGGNTTGTKATAGTGTTGSTTADTVSAASANTGVKVLASLDRVMNASGLSVLNPIDDAKVIVARGAAVMLGLLFLVAGGAILVKELLGAEQAQSLLNGAGPIGTGARRLTAAAPIAALAA